MRLEERIMNEKCPKCGSGNIMEGKLSTGMGGLVFVVKESQKQLPFTHNYSMLTAKGCRECGAVFDIYMDDPQAIDTTK